MQIDVNYLPRPQFRSFHNRTQRYGCIVAHRRCGKTVACIVDLLLDALKCTKARPRYAYIAPLLKQAKDIAWPYLKDFVAGFGKLAKCNESELSVTLPNGAVVRLYGADNPDILRGIYLDGCILDEYANMGPTLWQDVIRPAISDRLGWVVFIGTPRGRDLFFNVYRESTKNAEKWYTAMLKASETNLIPQDELRMALEDMGPSQYAREYECSFDEADVAQFISGEEIKAAVERAHDPDWEALYDNQDVRRPVVMGVDVARFGDDRSVILVRRGDVVQSKDIHVYRGLDLMQIAGRVAEKIDQVKPQAIMVDGVGLGAGVVDRLKQLGYGNVTEVQAAGKAKDQKHYCNKRAEMWGRLRGWIRQRAILSDSVELADDLTCLLYDFDSGNRMKIESKAELKKRGLPSPDMGDALALTFAINVAPPDVAHRAGSFRQKAEVSPFAEL